MRIVIQRVSEASVTIDGSIHGKIDMGFVVLLGIEEIDTEEDADFLIGKLAGMRVFSDPDGKMNLSIKDVRGAFLVISQFTLHASTKKGNRPSFIKAARPEQAIPLYEYFVKQLRACSELQVETGVFGADMKVALVNDGPVTILMDSKNRE
ncbi:MAG: D-aminoacyl-tRNA deacylase [Fluviicola sp.]